MVVASALAGLRYRGIVPTLSPDSITPAAYMLSGFCGMLVAVALFILKPRVPGRRPQQSVEAYWSAPEVGAKVFLVWFVMDSAGMMAAVGYFLTGELVSAVAMGLAIVAFWLCGPHVFAKA